MMSNEFLQSMAKEVIAILVPILIAWLVGEISGLLGKLRAWLDAKKHSDLSNAIGLGNTALQMAAENYAGLFQRAIRKGDVDPLNPTSVKNWLTGAEQEIVAKMPGVIATVAPKPGAIADMIVGKREKFVPTVTPDTPILTINGSAATALPADGSFVARAGIVIGRLMRDLALTREQAAGIVGNLGQESGLRAIQEIRPASGRGGFGWAQWTGVRRIAFEAWAKAQGLSVTDDEANYGFLIEELKTTESAALTALRQTVTLEEATRVFEEKFERAGIVALAKRQTFAEQAFGA